MNRREAISRVGILMGCTIIGAELFISGCTTNPAIAEPVVLTASQMKYLNEVAETILPKTAGSGGAKEANVAEFMQTMVRDCYSPKDQQVFITGLTELDKYAGKNLSKDFLSCSPQERQQLLVKLDAEAKDYRKKNELLEQQEILKEKDSQGGGKPNYLKKTYPAHYFTMIKQLSLLGFFTSEIGYKSMGYVLVPTRYDGDVTHPQKTS